MAADGSDRERSSKSGSLGSRHGCGVSKASLASSPRPSLPWPDPASRVRRAQAIGSATARPCGSACGASAAAEPDQLAGCPPPRVSAWQFRPSARGPPHRGTGRQAAAVAGAIGWAPHETGLPLPLAAPAPRHVRVAERDRGPAHRPDAGLGRRAGARPRGHLLPQPCLQPGLDRAGVRVLIGLAGGIDRAGRRRRLHGAWQRLLGHVLTPVGLAVISISLVGATRLYGLVPVEVGLAVALLSAVVAAMIAVRSDSQVVAAFGLVAVLLAPPLMGATPDMATLAFIAVVLVGTTAVALWRSWSWLPPTAFLLSAPQAAVWVTGHPEPAVGLLGIGLFWGLNMVAAGGEAFRRHRDDLSPSSATLLLANVAFVIWAGFVLLSGDLVAYRGFFLVLVALAQLGVGGPSSSAMATGTCSGSCRSGPGSPPSRWPRRSSSVRRRCRWPGPPRPWRWPGSRSVAATRTAPSCRVVLFALAGGYVANLYGGPIASTTGVPFVDGPGAALAFFIAAVAIGVWLVRDRSLRGVLAAFGLVVAAVCVPAVLDAASTTIALSILMVVGAAAWRVIPALPAAPIEWQVEGLIPRAAPDRRLAGPDGPRAPDRDVVPRRGGDLVARRARLRIGGG